MTDADADAQASSIESSLTRSVVKTAIEQAGPGSSNVHFYPGRSAQGSANELHTVALVLIELSPAARTAVYDYINAIQVLSQSLRPVIITDGADLRVIRRFGWFTEHVIARRSFMRLEVTGDWTTMVADRVLTTIQRLDVSHSIVCEEGGVSLQQHNGLMSLLRRDIPFRAVAIRSGAIA